MKRFSHFSKGTALLLSVLMLSFLIPASADTLSEADIAAIVQTQTDASKVISPFTLVADQVRNSVVGVNNYASSTYYSFGFGFGNQPGERRETLSGTGSGVVVTPYGHILTNYHVIEDASRITITIADDETEHAAQLVASDADLDIAVLYAPTIQLPAVPLGDSDALQVGEWAIVIGNPLGKNFARTTTVGVVSALDRQITDTTLDRYGRRINITNSMIQVDAAINSGNSGGGLFNTLGQLQGIPSRKYSANSLYSSTTIDNIGMCIPINVAKPLIEQALRSYSILPETTTPQTPDQTAQDPNNPLRGRPRLGVSGNHLTSTYNGTLPLGVLIKTVDANSPAENGGLRPGDIIVEADGEIITTMSQLQNKLAGHQEGDQVNIKVYRDEAIASQIEQDRIDLTDAGNGEYIDLVITLRIVDDLNL